MLHLEGMGKSGFVLKMDDEGNGYFISMDFVNGFVQIRRWGFNPHDYHNNFTFDNLQTGIFEPATDRKIQFRLICYGYRSEEHTSELQSRGHLVCRLLLEKKKEQHISLD